MCVCVRACVCVRVRKACAGEVGGIPGGLAVRGKAGASTGIRANQGKHLLFNIYYIYNLLLLLLLLLLYYDIIMILLPMQHSGGYS